VSTPGNILARFSHPSFAKREGDAAEDIVCTGGCELVSPATSLLFETSPLTSSVRGVKSSFCIWICPSTAGVCCGDNGSCVVC
jgi:hypothetical protein